MLRKDIISAIQEITEILVESNIYRLLSGRSRTSGAEIQAQQGINSLVLKSLNQISIRYQNFSTLQKEIFGIMELSPLCDIDQWPNLINNDKERTYSLIVEVRNNVNFAIHNLPKITQLFNNESIEID